MKKEQYLGVNVITLNYDEIIEDIKKRMEADLTSTIIAVNPEKVITASKDEQIKTLINDATYQIPDGGRDLNRFTFKRWRDSVTCHRR